MPTYDYKCKNCEITFEVFQKMSDEPIKKCSKCGGEVKRLIGGGLKPIFKGSGFYETDYKTKTTADKKNLTSENSKQTNSTKKTESKKQ